MRKDVKAGMAFSLVIVVLAGWYYTRDNDTGGAIPLDNRVTPVGDSSDSGLDAGATPKEETKNAPSAELSKPASKPSGQSDKGKESPKVAAEEKGASDVDGEIRIGLTNTERELLLADRGGDTDLPVEPAVKATPPDSPVEPKAEDTLKGNVNEQKDSAPEVTLPVPKAAASEPEPQKDKKVKTKSRKQAGDKKAGKNTDSVERYTVQAGDSLAILAEVYYGSQRFTDFLLQGNPQISNENQLRVGMVINIPDLPDKTRREILNSKVIKQTGSAKKEVQGKRTYTVKAGDSFYRIAEQQLGAANRWKEILELNKSLVGGDPQRLRPGQVLILPEK